MVGLKYLGRKKIPFIYEGGNIRCGKMHWGKTGQVISVPLEDAELMVATSPTDFEMVLEGYETPDEPIEDIEKEDEFAHDPDGVKEPEGEEVNPLACTHDECDFVAKAPRGLKMHIDRKHPKIVTPVAEIEE